MREFSAMLPIWHDTGRGWAWLEYLEWGYLDGETFSPLLCASFDGPLWDSLLWLENPDRQTAMRYKRISRHANQETRGAN